jgi:hypothetical protein
MPVFRGSTRLLRLGHWLALLGLISSGLPIPAANPVVITSSSKQFTVRGQRLGHLKDTAPSGSSLVLLDPSLLAVTAENVRYALARELGWGPEWRGRVLVDLHPVQVDNQPILIRPIRSPQGWSYHIDMPDEVDAPRLMQALVEVLVNEFASRQAGDCTVELPPWLVPGLAAHLRSGPLDASVISPNRPVVRTRVQKDPLAAVRARLQTHTPLTVEQLNWPAPDQFEEERTAQYEASAHLFVRELLRLRGGPDGLTRMLTLLPEHLNWQLAFLRAFQSHFERLIDLEKWWALVLANFSGYDPAQKWSRPESLQRLDEVLYTPVQVRLATNEIPHDSQVSLQVVLAEWDYPQQVPVLRTKVVRFVEMKPHLAPEVAALADDYQAVLEVYLRGQARAASEPVSWPGLAGATPALAHTALRRLNALDDRRQRLWNPAPGTLSGKAARPGPQASTREKATAAKRK